MKAIAAMVEGLLEEALKEHIGAPQVENGCTCRTTARSNISDKK